MSATDMPAVATHRASHLLLLGAATLTVVNSFLLLNLYKRLERTEARAVAQTQNQLIQQMHSVSQENASHNGNQRADRTSPATVNVSSGILEQMRAREADSRVLPEQWSRNQDELLTREPSLPDVELKHKQWLDKAYQTLSMDERTPPAEDVQTACQGRRCMVSAIVSDRAIAHKWATRFLLTAGGTYLTNSKVAVLPASNGDYVNLQIYLY